MPKGLKSLARLLDEVPFAPVAATLFGLAAAILVIATPGWLFERTIVASGLPPVLAAAAPPFGQGAQLIAALLAALGTAGILWLLFGPIEALMKPSLPQSRGHRIEPYYHAPEDEAGPIALGHRPLFASTDLGTPILPDESFPEVRKELVLDMPVPEVASAAPETEDAPPLVPAAVPLAPRAIDRIPVSGPFDYLTPRDGRVDGDEPVLPGEVAARRDANGGSRLLH